MDVHEKQALGIHCGDTFFTASDSAIQVTTLLFHINVMPCRSIFTQISSNIPEAKSGSLPSQLDVDVAVDADEDDPRAFGSNMVSSTRSALKRSRDGAEDESDKVPKKQLLVAVRSFLCLSYSFCFTFHGRAAVSAAVSVAVAVSVALAAASTQQWMFLHLIQKLTYTRCVCVFIVGTSPPLCFVSVA